MADGPDSCGPRSSFLGGPIPAPAPGTTTPRGSTEQVLDRLSTPAGALTRYEEPEEIARGGMGMIQRIWDRDLRRFLVRKVMLLGRDRDAKRQNERMDPRVIQRFLEEAQITGQLDHPGIVPVHDIGVDEEGRLWFTMPLVQGEELGRVIEQYRQGATEWSRARLLAHLLLAMEAVAFAHSRSVIHRDLKPENIMVGRFGQTYVMDWGLARVVRRGESEEADGEDAPDLDVRPIPLLGPDNSGTVSTSRDVDSGDEADGSLVTVFGDLIGTPGYMAPEQARGEHERVGPRSDVYAMGAVLYQLLTGHRPYSDPIAKSGGKQLFDRILEDRPTPIRELSATEPEELVAIAEKAMSAIPSERYASMVEMTEDLRAYLEGRVVSAYETGVRAEFRKWVMRNKLAASLIALVLLTGLFGSIAFFQQQQRSLDNLSEEQARTENERERVAQTAVELEDALDRAERQKEEADRARRQAEQESVLNENLRREAERERESAQLSNLSQQESSIRARRTGYAANLLAAQLFLRDGKLTEARRSLEAADVEFRGFEWQHLSQRLDMSLRTGSGPAGTVLGAGISPGKFVATLGGNGRISLWDPSTAELLSEHSLGPETGACALATSEDGVLVVGCEDGALWAFPEPGELGKLSLPVQLTTPAELRGNPIRHAGFAQGGERFYAVFQSFGGGAHTVGFDAPLGRSSGRVVAVTESSVTALACDPGRDRYALGLTSGELLLSESGQQRPIVVQEGLTGAISTLAFGSDSSTLLLGDASGWVRDLDLDLGTVRKTFQRELQVRGGLLESTPHESKVTALCSCLEGQRLLSADANGRLCLWDLETGGFLAELRGHLSAIRSLQLDPSEQVIWSGSDDGTVRAWLPLSGEALSELKGDPFDSEADLWFSSDATRLFVARGLEGRWWDAKRLTPDENPVTSVRSLDSPLINVGGRDQFLSASLDQPLLLDERGNRVGRGDPLPGLPVKTSTDALGQRAAFVARTATGQLRFLLYALSNESNNLRLVLDLPLRIRQISTLALSPDGAYAAIAEPSGGVVLIDVDAGRRIGFLVPKERELNLGIGQSVALALRMAVFQAQLGRNTLPFRTELEASGTHELAALAFDPTGELLAVSFDERLAIWELAGELGTERTGPSIRHRLAGHEGPISDLAFTARGDRLASASLDGTLRLWEPRIGTGLIVLENHAEPILAVAFDPEGSRLASVDRGGTLLIHETDLGTLTPGARERATELALVDPRRVREVLAEGTGLLETAFGVNPNFANDLVQSVSRVSSLLPLGSSRSEEDWQVVRDPGRPRLEYEQAYARIRGAAERRPSDDQLQFAKAVTELRLERHGDALTTLDALARDSRRPIQPEIWAVRSMSLAGLGRFEEAEDQLEAMQEDPSWPDSARARSFHREARSLLDELSLR